MPLQIHDVVKTNQNLISVQVPVGTTGVVKAIDHDRAEVVLDFRNGMSLTFKQAWLDLIEDDGSGEITEYINGSYYFLARRLPNGARKIFGYNSKAYSDKGRDAYVVPCIFMAVEMGRWIGQPWLLHIWDARGEVFINTAGSMIGAVHWRVQQMLFGDKCCGELTYINGIDGREYDV